MMVVMAMVVMVISVIVIEVMLVLLMVMMVLVITAVCGTNYEVFGDNNNGGDYGDTGRNTDNNGTWLFTLRYFMTTCEVYLGRLII